MQNKNEALARWQTKMWEANAETIVEKGHENASRPFYGYVEEFKQHE